MGYASFSGAVLDVQAMTVDAPALACAEVAAFARGDHDPTAGVWHARADGIPLAVYRATDHRELRLGACALQLDVTANGDSTVTARITTEPMPTACTSPFRQGRCPRTTTLICRPAQRTTSGSARHNR